jgi:hypothetical protein
VLEDRSKAESDQGLQKKRMTKNERNENNEMVQAIYLS